MRSLAPATQALIAGGQVKAVLLLRLGFDPVIHANSSAVDIAWAGQTWVRAGMVGAVDPVRDSSGELAGLKFTLSGVPSDNVALALGESARGKACNLHLALLDPETEAIVEVIQDIFAGELDQMPLSEDGSTATIGVTAIHIGQLFARPKPLMYTDADQQRLYPGDTCLRFLNSQAQHKDVWPAASWGRK